MPEGEVGAFQFAVFELTLLPFSETERKLKGREHKLASVSHQLPSAKVFRPRPDSWHLMGFRSQECKPSMQSSTNLRIKSRSFLQQHTGMPHCSRVRPAQREIYVRFEGLVSNPLCRN